ncbi:ATP-binding protein [Rhodoferax sp. PAMC 29310]|uniref:hybrid sensor histidine kinase/response regulator n=1 Tax=Rhodoferax sp. PAMC 29310 TaxID=2822760 RepID=UPI001B31DA96|nr:ATP-binding protein [Rhodoferax sp. PAMC 29310]
MRQVAVETALFHELRSQDQWQRKMASISSEIDRMPTTTTLEESSLERLRKKIDLMQIIYPRLTSRTRSTPDGSTTPGSELEVAMETRAVASLLVVTQEVIDIAHELIRGNREQAKTALLRMQTSIGMVILAMGALIVFVWLLVSRRILQPLRIFEQGTKQLAAGNYAHRLKLVQNDEIGDLAEEFNAMIQRVEAAAVELGKHRDNLAEQVLSRTTELTKAKVVAESLSQYARSLIEASLDPLVTISAQGKITDVNDASVQATGVPREQLIGTDFSSYFTEPEEARKGYQRTFSEGLVRNYPLAIRHKTGRIMDVLYNAAVYTDAKGMVLGVFAAARDITERKLLDQVLHEKNAELERATAAAEKANLGKSDFLSSMSHELRTPLNAILGFAQLIESDSPAPTVSQKRSLDQVLIAGWYLLELINEILDLAQIESGKIVLSLEPVSMVEVMDECRAMVEPLATKRCIKMTFSPLESAYFIEADRTRMKQVLINLLSNAIKYNKPGGSVILTCAVVAANSIRINIQDTGTGLTPEQMAQLFQPFNRLGRESGPEEGTGIGLVVAKRLVELMGGTIGVESAVGVGSAFWIEFKLKTARQLDIEDAAQVVLARPPVPEGTQARTLLYVEDNPANLELIEQLLARRSDLRVLSAADGNLGIEYARAYQPDVILMDINLPGIGGLEAMKVLRSDPSTAHIPIIALSANALPRDIEKSLAAGFFGYLTKPVKLDEFMDHVDLALKSPAAGWNADVDRSF